MRLLIATGYLVACLLWIYGPASSDQTDGIWWLVALGLLQPTFGALVGRWWAVPVPIALVPMSIPAGYGSGELPLWFGVMFLAAFAAPLVLGGVVARKFGAYYVRRNESRYVAVAGICIAVGLVALGAFLGLSSGRSAGFRGNSTVSEAKQFRGFPVFYAGRDVNGYELALVRRQSLGPMRKDQESFGFTYGTCEGGNDACNFPVEISNEPACSRNLAMYGPLSPVPHRARLRGAPAAFFEGGSRIEIQTGTTTVVIFAFSRREALEVARNLRGVNTPVGIGQVLPPPAPGALQGKVPCPR